MESLVNKANPLFFAMYVEALHSLVGKTVFFVKMQQFKSHSTLQCQQKIIILGATFRMGFFRNEKHVAVPGQSVRTDAIKMVLWQFAVILVFAFILFMLRGSQSGTSVLLGGLAYCLPNLMFVWRVFKRTTARAARQFLVAFLLGEVMKLLLSAVLFVLIVKYLPIKVIWVLAGYIVAIMAFWVVSFITLSQE